jgi:chemotaxis protein methyltransferase CheR
MTGQTPAVEALLAWLEEATGVDYRRHEGRRIAARVARLCRRLGEQDAAALIDRYPAIEVARGLAPEARPLFDEPELWGAIRQRVVPHLRTFPRVNVWLPGCGRGEAAFALAILLYEHGLHRRSRVYATDVCEEALAEARGGRVEAHIFDGATRDYPAAGGRAALEEYYRVEEGQAVVRPTLGERLVFAQHDLATDASFNEFQLVVCRGTLEELAPAARDRAQAVIAQSLCRFGVLAAFVGDSRLRCPDERFAALGGHPGLSWKVR